jgi:hypothetical protein
MSDNLSRSNCTITRPLADPFGTTGSVPLIRPLYGIVVAHNFCSLLALAFAFVGAYLGMALRKLVVAAA